MRGAANPAWKGDEASATQKHRYVNQRKPLTGVCQSCGKSPGPYCNGRPGTQRAKDDRPVLGALIDSLGSGDALVVAKLDRLTRSLAGFANVVDRAPRGEWSLVVVDQNFDLGTASGRAMAGGGRRFRIVRT